MRKYKFIDFFDYAQVYKDKKMALCAGISDKNAKKIFFE